MLLTIDFLQFETLVDGRTGLEVETFFDDGKFNSLLLATTLSHYYFILSTDNLQC